MQISHSARLAFLPERTLPFRLSAAGKRQLSQPVFATETLGAPASGCLTSMKHFKMMRSATWKAREGEWQMAAKMSQLNFFSQGLKLMEVQLVWVFGSAVQFHSCGKLRSSRQNLKNISSRRKISKQHTFFAMTFQGEIKWANIYIYWKKSMQKQPYI